MLVYGLRLLVALITFGVGVAASTLLHFERTVKVEKRVKACSPALLAAPAEAPPPPAPHTEPTLRWANLAGEKVEGGTLNGKAVSKPAPVYPPAARAARAQGTVAVRILVDERGDVASAWAMTGHPLLQQAAVEAARQARFAPTRISGRPVQVSGALTYNFVLR